ncbi:MAG: hypothetical protein N2504_01790 [candidate division WOR-3 bacterium]|nr:hypothetical protein [candidate division WOR-3 bacterium]MCX7947303.1 hypothetical protein [candidate division WOR-3 bacterium]MDW8150140.1 hypothetical protein [candidate division WOR-3 bacterium]
MGRKILILLVLIFACKKKEVSEDTTLINPILVEQFTNYKCFPCNGANEIVDSFQRVYSDKVFVVRYHVNVPYPNDPIYIPYSDSMVNYYNLDLSSGVPITIISGGFKDIGYDDTQREDYKQRWLNKMREFSKIEYQYKANGNVEHFGNSANVNITLDKSLSPNHRANIYITEYDVKLPQGSSKPYSHFALRSASTGLSANFTINESWNKNNLYILFVIRDENKKVISLWQGKLPNEILTYYLQNDSILNVNQNETGKFYLKLKNNTNQVQRILIDISGVPKTWTPILCFRGVCRNTTTLEDSILPNYETADSAFYFGFIPTTSENVIIEMKVSIEGKNLYKTINGRVIVP